MMSYPGVLVLVLLFLQPRCSEAGLWGWFSSGPTTGYASSVPDPPSPSLQLSYLAAFDVESAKFLSNVRGRNLVEKAKQQTSQNSCWHEAYTGLMSSCREILREEDSKARLAMKLTNCFLRVSDGVGDRSEAFKLETEHVVNELKGSAHWVETKLKTMETQSTVLLQQSEEQQRLHSELQERIKTGISGLNIATKEVYKELHGVASLQEEIVERQHSLSESLAMEFSSLHDKTHEIGDAMLRSLGGQAELLARQGEAMEGLHSLKRLQEDAMEEGRASVKELTSEVRTHQQDFLTWQLELHAMHQQLTHGSNAMLESQETFMSKQAAVFTSLERLFSLHNAILLESRGFKTLLFYAAFSIFVYMSTSTKQTHNARAILYCGLLLSFALELWLVRFHGSHPATGVRWISSLVFWPRYIYGVAAMSNLMYNICIYRDYANLSYKILVDLQQALSRLPALEMQEEFQQTLGRKTSHSRTSPYERALAKKILRKARTCQHKLQQ